MSWEPSFVAVGVLLGEPAEAMVEFLRAPAPPDVAGLTAALEAPSRRARAQVLAGVVSEVARAVEAARLA
jgi:hypothetical protein